MMTFEEFQDLTTEQKLEVSMAHLAGVLHGQVSLSDDEKSPLLPVQLPLLMEELEEQLRELESTQSLESTQVLLRTLRRLSAPNRQLKSELFSVSDVEPFLLSDIGLVEIVSEGEFVVGEGEFEVESLTVRERGAKSAARKPKPVKKA